ncbi:hypothetical protein Pflav_079990 [Phytohabitans flavus]|uniref:Uncharacterized protein n=1 Tax=Phytohabitans flavus TaxID=1076124 RepID=A0A6F8Y6D2_9ACTN|nr:hypothetical protein Pflav_079990 [Phytohabitans flavus]
MDGRPDERAGAVAADLDRLALDLPALAPIADDMRSLATVLRADARTVDWEGWTEVDLVAAYVDRSSLAPMPRRLGRLRALLDLAPAVLVFVPVLVTWFGLAAATSAYDRMRRDPELAAMAVGRTFLDLWQDGFGGTLPGALAFGHVAVYTLTAILLLIIATVGGWTLDRRDRAAEAARAEYALGRLRGVLVRAQRVLGGRRLMSPQRFAGELTKAAQILGDLVERTDRTQRTMDTLAERSADTARRLVTAITELRGAAGTLESGGNEVRAATQTLQTAAGALRTDVTTTSAAAAERLDAATATSLDQVRELQNAGAAALAAATNRLEASLSGLDRSIEASLSGLGERIDGSLSGLHTRIEAATSGLREAAGTFATDIQAAGVRAATDVTELYQEAVAAAAVSLAREMARAGDVLRDAVAAGAAEHTAALEHNTTRTAGAAGTLAEAVRQLSADVDAAREASEGALAGAVRQLSADVTAAREAGTTTEQALAGAVRQLSADVAAAREASEGALAGAVRQLSADVTAAREAGTTTEQALAGAVRQLSADLGAAANAAAAAGVLTEAMERLSADVAALRGDLARRPDVPTALEGADLVGAGDGEAS